MELKMESIVYDLKSTHCSFLDDKEEAFEEIVKSDEFLTQHKEGDKYIMLYEESQDAWYLCKLL